jgi:catalase
MVDNLAHVDEKLARRVAEPLGIGAPDAKAAAGRAGFREARIKLPIESSPALSMETAGGHIHTRKVAILVADGVETGAMKIVQQALLDAGAICKIVGPHLGFVSTSSGQQLAVDFTYVNMPSVMFDAVLVPSGAISAKALVANGDAVHFVLEAFKHFKTVCVIGEGVELLRSLGITGPESAAVAGVLVGKSEPTARVQLAQDFVAAIGKHRHWGRANVDAVPA